MLETKTTLYGWWMHESKHICIRQKTEDLPGTP